MTIRPSTTVVAAALRWRCHSPADMKTDMTSRAGFFFKRMYSGRNREGWPDVRRRMPVEGPGAGRGKTKCDEQMATRSGPENRRVKASESDWSHKGTHESGRQPGKAAAGVQKMLPSAENLPIGRCARAARVGAQGKPTRSACRKAYIEAG
jgi:hypothetical protein